MAICGLTIVPLRLIIYGLIWVCWSSILRIIWIGSDITKPLPLWKSYLTRWTHKLWTQLILFNNGCYVNYKKVRI
jgi:hypothetical protein